MSMKKHKGVIVYRCDGPGCAVTADTGAKAFFTALNILKGRGWSLRKIKVGIVAEAWRHFCCQHCETAALDKAHEADQGAGA